MDDAASWRATGISVALSQMGSRYALGWNLERGGRVRWQGVTGAVVLGCS